MNDYLVGLRTFHDLANYITLNISSPNTDNLRSFHVDSKLEQLLRTIEKVKEKLKSKIPLVVKISPDILDEQINHISEYCIKRSSYKKFIEVIFRIFFQ